MRACVFVCVCTQVRKGKSKQKAIPRDFRTSSHIQSNTIQCNAIKYKKTVTRRPRTDTVHVVIVHEPAALVTVVNDPQPLGPCRHGWGAHQEAGMRLALTALPDTLPQALVVSHNGMGSLEGPAVHTWQNPTVSRYVSWCFTPSQPVRLYQGEKHLILYI